MKEVAPVEAVCEVCGKIVPMKDLIEYKKGFYKCKKHLEGK